MSEDFGFTQRGAGPETRLLHCTALGIAVALAVWASSSGVAQSNQLSDCLKSDRELTLGGVRLGDPYDGVTNRLGQPAKVIRGIGEDDGGTYEELELVYPDLTVTIARAIVDQVRTTSPKVTTPSGIRPRLRLGEVRRILGLEPKRDVNLGPDQLSIYFCNYENYLWFRVTDDGAIKELGIGTYRP